MLNNYKKIADVVNKKISDFAGSKSLVQIIVTVLIFNSSLAVGASLKWHDPVCWDKLTRGLNPNEVILFLGTPAAKDTDYHKMIYYYQKIPQKGSPLPSSGIVRFRGNIDKRTRRVSYTLFDFKPPKWDLIEKPPPQKNPALIASEQKATRLQAQLDAQKAARTRRDEYARLAKLRQQKRDIQRQQRMATLAKQEKPFAEPDTTLQLSWIQENTLFVSVIIGIAFLAFALLIAAFGRKSWD